MNCYAGFILEQSPINPASYLLKAKFGKVQNLTFPRYSEIQRNIEAGINGKEYLIFGKPRDISILRYFARTFELGNGKVLTSTEEITERKRIFGDAKKIGLNDLILFQFSYDMKTLEMYFIRGCGISRRTKTECFRKWNNGELLMNESGEKWEYL